MLITTKSFNTFALHHSLHYSELSDSLYLGHLDGPRIYSSFTASEALKSNLTPSIIMPVLIGWRFSRCFTKKCPKKLILRLVIDSKAFRKKCLFGCNSFFWQINNKTYMYGDSSLNTSNCCYTFKKTITVYHVT